MHLLQCNINSAKTLYLYIHCITLRLINLCLTIWWCFILFLCDTLHLQNLISVYEYFNHLCKTSENCKHLITQCTIRCQNHLTSNSTLKALICSSTLEANWHEIESDSVLSPCASHCLEIFGLIVFACIQNLQAGALE